MYIPHAELIVEHARVIDDLVRSTIPHDAVVALTPSLTRIATALSEDDQRRYRNSPIDTHLNAEGNALVAKSVLEQLAQLGLLLRSP